jgi:hypothetical protein
MLLKSWKEVNHTGFQDVHSMRMVMAKYPAHPCAALCANACVSEGIRSVGMGYYLGQVKKGQRCLRCGMNSSPDVHVPIFLLHMPFVNAA